MASDDFRTEIAACLPRLRRFALSLCGDLDTADDLVQSTCIRALASAAQWQPGTRLDSWMYKIMQNHWIDQRRSPQAKAGVSAVEDLDSLPEQADFEEQMHQRLTLAQVLAAMGRLPEQARTLLALVSVEGLSYREAAEVLDLPIGTVMSRLARARLALRAQLEEVAV